MCLLCIGCCVALSLIVGLFYIKARVPIIITTIGFALLYESVTCLIFGGTGINILTNMTLNQFARYPTVLYPLAAVIAIYAIYSYVNAIPTTRRPWTRWSKS